MGVLTGGELFGYVAPGATDTVEIPIVLTSAAGARVTGVTWDAAGMDVKYRKEGAHTFSSFPSFATTNWVETGYGEYLLILDGAQADEAALMDTVGTLTVYVKTTATEGNFAKVKVNSADVMRAGATVSVNTSALLSSTVTFADGATATFADCLKAAWAQGKGDWVISGTNFKLLGPDKDPLTPEVEFTLDDADAPMSRTAS